VPAVSDFKFEYVHKEELDLAHTQELL
jgi:hypothetical protein